MLFALVCTVFGAGCSTWKPTSRPLVSKSGELYAFPQKYRFEGDLRVALTDSSIVELSSAYALDYTLFGKSEGEKMEIPFETIQRVEEKHTPRGFSPRAFVVVGLLVTGLVIGAASGP